MKKGIFILAACLSAILIFCGDAGTASAAAENRSQAAVMQLDTFVNTPAIPIPDNTYNGTIGTMGCNTIDTTAIIPAGNVIGAANVTIAQSHTFVGDLTIKLIPPSGTTVTLVSRPGVIETADDGNDTAGFGENSNLAIANPLTYGDANPIESEMMGRSPVDLPTGSTVCVDGGTPCVYNPDNGAANTTLETFAALDNQPAVGTWQLCIGDSAGADTGTFQSWTLRVTSTPGPVASNASIGGRVVTPNGQGIGKVAVVLTGGNLNEPRYALTNAFGYYNFEDLQVGATYVVSVQAKRYTFSMPSRVISLEDNVGDADFISEP